MKRQLLFLFSVMSAAIAAQEEQKPFKVSGEIGYSKSSYHKGNQGTYYLQTGLGKAIGKKNLWLNLDLITSNARNTANDSNQTFLIVPNVSKDYPLGKWVLTPSLGVAGIFESTKYLAAQYTSSTTPPVYSIDNDKEFAFGAYANLALKTRVGKNVYLGINAKTYYQLWIGIETFMLGSSVEIKL